MRSRQTATPRCLATSGSPWYRAANEREQCSDGSERTFRDRLHSETPVPGVSYTSDSTYLRLRELTPGSSSTERELDFPDGETHRFDSAGNLLWMRDAFGSEVTVTQTPTQWTIADPHGRTQTIAFASKTYDGVARPTVTSVTLTAFGGASAVYTFRYAENTTITRACADNSDATGPNVIVPLLVGIDLPDGSSFEMPLSSYHQTVDCNANVNAPAGMIASLQLPSLGKLTWTYGGYQLGNELRRLTAIGVTSRSQLNALGTELGMWTYANLRGPSVGVEDARTVYGHKTTTITAPDQTKTIHYFSVYDGDAAYPAGWTPYEYGLPLTRATTDGDNPARHLSTEIVDAFGVTRRKSFVRYETELDMNRRLQSRKTVYSDDGDRVAVTDFDDFDALGHYRDVDTGGTFSAGNVRGGTTNFNPGDVIPSASSPWLLSLFTKTSVEENGVTAKTQSCFDSATGFLKRQRTLAGTTPGATDLLAVFTPDTAGNVIREEYYGGDGASLATSALCTMPLPLAPAYRIDHEYSHGVLSRSYYVRADGTAMFNLVNGTIDGNTGMAASSTDGAGHTTTFAYDAAGRLTAVTPLGVAPTTYAYGEATVLENVFTPASVTATTTSATPALGSIESEVRFDALGRRWRERTRLANGQWSVRETLYDGTGRTRSVSEPAVLTVAQGQSENEVIPPKKTTFAYDALGRPASITAPDGSVVSHVYEGARTVLTSSVVGTANVGKMDEYDRQGRLIAVTENYDFNPLDELDESVTTTYTYDVGSRLSGVTMAGQMRTFNYDRRGLLVSETHPELGTSGYGTKTYGNYDARGHARRVTTGAINGAFDVKVWLDRAERIEKITHAPNDAKILKQFQYDVVPGRLSATARYHDDVDLGNVVVTESYQYNGAGGRLSRRDQAIGGGTVAGESFFFSQAYNDLGAVSSIRYPCRVGGEICTTSDRTPPEVLYRYTNGYLTGIDGWGALTYQPNGVVATVTHGSGPSTVTETWTSDPNGMARANAIEVRKSGASTPHWASQTYTYDGVGNIRSIGGTTFDYDAFGRVVGTSTTHANLPTSAWQKRSYDVFGNLLDLRVGRWMGGQKEDDGGGAGAPWKQVAGTTNHYVGSSYDAAGNVTADEARTFTYDAFNMTTRAVVNGRDYRYLYTAGDERIGVVERVTSTDMVTRNRITWTVRGFDEQLLSVWKDQSATGNGTLEWTNDEIWRGALLFGENTPNGKRHFSLDHLGSVRVVTDASGDLVGLQSFDPFGAGGSSNGGPLQYTGHERDAALYGRGDGTIPDYLHARSMETMVGRFLSVDPVGGSPRRPQGWNRYSYVANNPINWIDPQGLTEKQPCPPRECPPRDVSDPELWDARFFLESRWVFNAWRLHRALQSTFDTKAARMYYEAQQALAAVAGDEELASFYNLLADALITEPPPGVYAGTVAFGSIGNARMNALQTASNPRLVNMIDQLYRPTAKVGSGSTADAIRHEMRTGELLSKSGHFLKGMQSRTALLRIFRGQPLTAAEKELVWRILVDIQNALSGR